MSTSEPSIEIEGVTYTWRNLPGSSKDTFKRKLHFALLKRGKITLKDLQKSADYAIRAQEAKKKHQERRRKDALL